MFTRKIRMKDNFPLILIGKISIDICMSIDIRIDSVLTPSVSPNCQGFLT